MVFAGSLSSNEARQLKLAKDAERSTLINKTKDRLEKAGFRISPIQNGSSSPAAAAKGGNEGENATRNGGGRRDLNVYLHATGKTFIIRCICLIMVINKRLLLIFNTLRI